MSNSVVPRVFVGMSGGVDSSVAALRLKKQGYDVVGVFIKVWHPDWLVCDWETERLDAMRVAAALDIPFLTCDAEDAYRDDVASYFIREYTAGRTPNPDVMCNKYVKFGAFLNFALDHKADYIATGHYARRVDTTDHPSLHRGIDPNKDQSYFLWTLTNEQLSRTLLPIGDSLKETIRREAAIAGLPTALKRDSQGICFLGHIDIKEFLRHYTDLKAGAVLDEAGIVIGEHQGALVYTPGQRHGFTITKKEATRQPYYVVSKNIDANTITVSPAKPTAALQSTIKLENTVWRTTPRINARYDMQTRYRQQPTAVSVVSHDFRTLLMLEQGEPAVLGQSCVLYDGTLCLGGGIIS